MKRLGRRGVKTDSRTPKLGRYLELNAPSAPPSVNYLGGVTEWGSMLNDTLGCCTIAGLGHAKQVWTLNGSGTMVTVSDEVIEDYYEWIDGYVPGNPSTDNGGIELDVLRFIKKKGFEGRDVAGFVGVSPAHTSTVKQCIYLFGGAYIGLNVPDYIMAGEPPAVWDFTDQSYQIVGGHCVFVPAYTAGSYQFISWGNVYTMTQAFWDEFVDEAWGILDANWVGTKRPVGLNLTQLLSDLQAIH